MMLRDYLSKDVSSCSSSGFQSYPRLRCCSVVRRLAGPRETPPPFPGGAPASPLLKTTLHILPRFLSRKLLRRRAHRKKPVEDHQVIIRLQAYFQMDPFTPPPSQFHHLHSPENVGEPAVIDRVNVSDVEDSPVSSAAGQVSVAERWTKRDKEHSSPVSVLDYDSTLNCYSQNPKEKTTYCDELSDLDPVDLLDRYVETDSDGPLQTSPMNCANWGFAHDDADAEEILGIGKLAARGFHIHKLLMHLVETHGSRPQGLMDQLGDWLKGKADDVALGWDLEQGRAAYLREVERNDDADKLQENEGIVFEIEEKAFSDLLEEELKIMLHLDHPFYRCL